MRTPLLAATLALSVGCGAPEPSRQPAGSGGSSVSAAGQAGFASGGTGGMSGPSAGSGGKPSSGGSGGATEAGQGGVAGQGGSNNAGTGGGGAAGGGVVVPPQGTVPLFVGVGYGTRTVVSCDFGLTWPYDMADVPNGGDDGTLARGLGYGAGRFVAAVGGGGTQKLFMAENGWSWQRNDLGGNGFSDVAYGNGYFIAGGGHVSKKSEDGSSWGDEGTMGDGGILRHLTFGDYQGGRFVAVGDDGRRMNSMDGVTWGNQVSDGTSIHGVAYGAGHFVAITDSARTVFSADGGVSWEEGNLGADADVRGILFDGARFIVTTSGDTFTSSDGINWQAHQADGGPSRFDVSWDRKHYAGALGGSLYYSTDGISFTQVKGGGQGIERVKFGYAQPSGVCPLPP